WAGIGKRRPGPCTSIGRPFTRRCGNTACSRAIPRTRAEAQAGRAWPARSGSLRLGAFALARLQGPFEHLLQSPQPTIELAEFAVVAARLGRARPLPPRPGRRLALTGRVCPASGLLGAPPGGLLGLSGPFLGPASRLLGPAPRLLGQLLQGLEPLRV